ncbi:MAG: prolyl oligopeptidase family serine peptidase [Planctomycetaceae bacterium]
MSKFPLSWLASIFFLLLPGMVVAEEKPGVTPLRLLREAEILSSLDGQLQSIRYWIPEKPGLHPVLLSLHSWSGDYKQDHSDWLREAYDREWVFLEPNFRGRNDNPAACGSALARQDLVDAIDWAIERNWADRERIYVAGVSGGGHMAMLLAAYHPQRISAVSAWVGISDLREWHTFHVKPDGPDNYALMTQASCGGAPGKSAEVDLEYYSRSPIHFLSHAASVPIDLNAGITDGKTGSVPIQHSLNAFNVIAKARNTPQITAEEIQQLWENGKLDSPQNGDTPDDPTYGRKIHLRRESGPSRVTLFEGGHEGLAHPACEWLAQQQRKTRIRGR